ncbi:putative multidrug resistance protein [Talaromyces proteolyticus]|uniref:Multidrug resistance protein n=1 Tax=Talaromyces proteolyticus TaxID=1131652 RepID=A0AAD4KKH5_9EURO|nr:putative multidrug resistance protein [Talaromyces proteolyticus]KAH8691336.1 putative multidrug resistance protein [Talaromyces proteolyticus]
MVHSYLAKSVPPAICLISVFIFWIRYVYSHFGDTKHIRSGPNAVVIGGGIDDLSPRYVTILPPLIARLEIVGVLTDIVLCVFLMTTREDSNGPISAAFASAVSSVYLLLLVLVRKKGGVDIEINLQRHSVALYTVQWFCLSLIVHAEILSGTRLLSVIAILIRFALFTTLCLFHWTAPQIPRRAYKTGGAFLSDLSKEETASSVSRLSFSWINELIWKAYRTTLEVEDLYPLNDAQKSNTVNSRFHLVSAPTVFLPWRLWRFFKYDILRQGGWAAVNSVAVFVPPILIRLILRYIESPDVMKPSSAWLCASGLLIAGVVAGTADCQSEWIGHQIAAKVRAILINEIYTKVLRKGIVQPGREEHKDIDSNDGNASDGGIFNLMSVDTEHVTTIGTWLLYKLLGLSGVIGVLIMIALLPLNILISQRVMAVQARVLKASDNRIQASNEMLSNVRTIKYSAWEKPFIARVLEKRQFEIKELRSRFIWWSINATTFHALPFIVTMVTCFFYTIVWDNPLGTTIAFPALTIFSILRIPLDRMATSITFIMRAHVSLGRIEKFLQERETAKYDQLSYVSTSIHIGFQDATLIWPTSTRIETLDSDTSSGIPLAELPSTRPFRLENLDIKFQTDALNVVCGASGSGKSSLLLGLLGELDLIKGHISLPHDRFSGEVSLESLTETTAYCPQEPWIMNRSIRENILLDLPFDSRRYEAVLQAVALTPDLIALDQGDQTLAGENGSRLSGGQKQRVSLARVLYSPSRYVLLDDCLSAVDSRTANHIFFHAVKGSLMKGRTCILATHHTHLAIPNCHYVIMLDNGRVIGQGTSEELVSMGLLEREVVDGNSETQQTISASTEKISEPINTKITIGDFSARSSLDSASLEELPLKAKEPESEPGYKEGKAEGAVTWPVVRNYLAAMGPRWYWIIVLALFGLQQVVSLGTNLWIKEWAFRYDMVEMRNSSKSPSQRSDDFEENKRQKVDAWYYITIYVAICLLYGFITFIRDLTTFYGSLKASSTIYERLLNSIFYAKLIFFDRVPFGQITNRLTKDIEVIDQTLAGFAVSWLQLFTSMLMVIILISTALPVFLIVAVSICAAYYIVTIVYINGARDLKRIEAVQMSPLYQQFGETFAGCVSIRAFARTSSFTVESRTLVDQLHRPYLLQWASQAWLTFRVDVLSSLISFFTGAFVIWGVRSIEPGIAGLMLAYAATFTENVMWVVQVYSIIQQNLNSVERIAEYTEVEQEISQPVRTGVYDLPEDWPSQGEVRLEKYSTRYSPELEPSLNEVSFETRRGERVAIVGRTGAGKSTLALALIRGLEAESGRIDIDGIDIASVPLEKLRQVITLLPQDPELFDGTLRHNLDPLQRYTDEEMITALHTVRLLDDTSDSISAIRTNTETCANGTCLDQAADALSRGQRQLLCIARALLRRSRVLVLDEATASIDHATDATIQESLRTSIAYGTTVITIAHRLLTIADYDKVIVLDKGRVVEQGSVRELLGRTGNDAIFRGLCEESGNLEEIERAATAMSLG